MNKNLVKDLTAGTEAEQKQYENNVVRLIRKRYSVNDELSILRKHLSGTNSEEFNTYNTYVEECKSIAKKEGE